MLKVKNNVVVRADGDGKAMEEGEPSAVQAQRGHLSLIDFHCWVPVHNSARKLRHRSVELSIPALPGSCLGKEPRKHDPRDGVVETERL